jgi:hypothetical protein
VRRFGPSSTSRRFVGWAAPSRSSCSPTWAKACSRRTSTIRRSISYRDVRPTMASSPGHAAWAIPVARGKSKPALATRRRRLHRGRRSRSFAGVIPRLLDLRFKFLSDRTVREHLAAHGLLRDARGSKRPASEWIHHARDLGRHHSKRPRGFAGSGCWFARWLNAIQVVRNSAARIVRGSRNLLPLASRVWQLLTSQRLAVPANDLTIAIRERLPAHGCATQEQAMLFS